jgi:hypothetical protein
VPHFLPTLNEIKEAPVRPRTAQKSGWNPTSLASTFEAIELQHKYKKKQFHRLWGSPNLQINWCRGIHGGKQPGREADHLPPFSAIVHKGWSAPPLTAKSSWSARWRLTLPMWLCGGNSVQTLSDLRSSQARVCVCVCVYTHTSEFSCNPNSNTLDPDLSQHDHPASAIAQQYCSATIVSCHRPFTSANKNWSRVLKVNLFHCLLFFYSCKLDLA